MGIPTETKAISLTELFIWSFTKDALENYINDNNIKENKKNDDKPGELK